MNDYQLERSDESDRYMVRLVDLRIDTSLDQLAQHERPPMFGIDDETRLRMYAAADLLFDQSK